jgi:CheY-like chemotaxis protein
MKRNIFSFLFPRPSASIRDIRVLVVEDNIVDQKIICNILKNLNYQVLTAHNGEEGIEIAKAMKPHLIIMDCEMPVMNGWDATRTLKENESTAKIPVVFLTSVKTPKNIVDCFDLDAENYLSKPVSAKVLRDQIPLILKDFSHR